MKTMAERINGSTTPKRPAPVVYRIDSPEIQLRRYLRPFQLERLLLHICRRRYLAKTEGYRRDSIDRDALLAKLARKRLIFLVTAGRTGTMFLTKLLELIPDSISLHEPEPAFQRYLRQVQSDPRVADEFLLRSKLPFIADLPTRVYIETSHVVSKGFLGPLINLGLVPSLILLRRPPRKIAVSYLERYTVPGRTKYGLEFLIHPGDPGVLPLRGWRRMTDYQLCFWYALEMERRQAYYGALVRELGGAVVDIATEELSDPDRFLDLVHALGLLDVGRAGEALRRGHAGVSTIEHNKNPQRIRIAGDIAAEEEVVWEAVSRFEPALRRNIARRYGATMTG
jgi:hypothetical protein